MLKNYKALKLYYSQLDRLLLGASKTIPDNVDKNKIESYLSNREIDIASSGISSLTRLVFERVVPFGCIILDDSTPKAMRVSYIISRVSGLLYPLFFVIYFITLMFFTGGLPIFLIIALIILSINIVDKFTLNFILEGHINPDGKYVPDFTKDK